MEDHPKQDRARAVRAALRTLVAQGGLNGAAMSAVADEAGVATGTAYNHYGSKEDLVIAAYVETKEKMGEVAQAAADPALPPQERFIAVWLAIHHFFSEDRDQARFLIQIESSPYLDKARSRSQTEGTGALSRIVETSDMAAELEPLSPTVLYELGVAPALRLAASQNELDEAETLGAAIGCWRAISRSA